VGPRAGLDTEVRGKNPIPLLGIEPRSPGRPVRSQTLYKKQNTYFSPRPHSTVILLVLFTKMVSLRVVRLFKICQHIQFHGSTLTFASFAPTSEV
jgi:hypothetical protein